MDIKQLDAFVNAADQGNFSRAAKCLHLTQPTVSAHIASLEKELGGRLFDRLPTEVVLTDTGKLLYDYAVKILQLRDQALVRCKLNGTNASDTIRIAASTIPHQYVLPIVTAEFHMKYPAAQFQLCGGDSAAVATAVLRGAVDVGMTGATIEDEELQYSAFMQDELVVVTPAAAPYLALQPKDFTLEMLAAAPLIAREPGSGTRAEAESYLLERGIALDALNIVAEIDNPDAIIKAVEEGLGISIVSRLSASSYERFGHIRVFPLEGQQVHRTLYFVQHKTRALPPMAAAFARFMNRTNPTG